MRLPRLLGISLPALLLLAAKPAHAVCPVCTVAVGVGLGLSRWLGIDDTVSGVWVGGLAVSLTIWTKHWLDKKHIRFIGRPILILVAYYALIFVPLYWSDIIGHPFNTLWGMDKLLLGSLFGGVAFLVGNALNGTIKSRNGGRAHFPFQKVVLPVSLLLAMSLAFYCYTRH